MKVQDDNFTMRHQIEMLSTRVEQEHAMRVLVEAENRKTNEFLANVCHELRTPLNAIAMEVQLLLEKGGLPQNVSNVLRTIKRNADAQARLITDLLETGPYLLKRMRLHLDNVDLREVLEDAIASVAAEAKVKSVQIILDLGPEIESSGCTGDVARLTQVFWNLIGNAVKFSPAKETVRVTAARRDDAVVISVTDHGCGIEPKFLPMIFERFWQARAATAQGLGLGLAIVKQIVELHGGAVKAESGGLNQGATFTVLLPAPPREICTTAHASSADAAPHV